MSLGSNDSSASSPLSIGVVIVGATGNMGKEAVKAVLAQPDMTLLGAVGRRYVGTDVAKMAGLENDCGVVVSDSLDALFASLKLDNHLKTFQHLVGIDLTNPNAVMPHAHSLIRAGFSVVIGTSGVEISHQQELNTALTQAGLGGAVIPNFAIGAVLMMRFAQEAAQYFDNVEIVELHHNKKLDAPSGTAHHAALSLSEKHPAPFNVPLVAETETIAFDSEFPDSLKPSRLTCPGLSDKFFGQFIVWAEIPFWLNRG
jgi:4-hydroxy-tetrahydrodipicolinate reductase